MGKPILITAVSMNRSHIVRTIAILCLTVLASTALFAFPTVEVEPAVVNISEKAVVKSVTVVGHGVVEAKPDMASVRIGVESVALSVDVALMENRQALSHIVSTLVDIGVMDADIQTANYSFNFDRSAPELAGARSNQATRYYRVNNMLTVVIRDLALTADIIDAAVVAGANQMWGVEFDVADRERLDREALHAASLDARERAQFIADLSGLRLGELLSVSEVVGYQAGGVAMRAEGFGGVASNVHPGLIQFSSQLQVVYSLESDTPSN